FIQGLKPTILTKEVEKFREINGEATFLVRSLFFLLFGFLIDINSLLSLELLKWSVLIIVAVLAVRIIQIKAMRLEVLPLLFIAPRGLITILLYLSIPVAYHIQWINKALIVQVIILSALMMSIGLLFSKNSDDEESVDPEAGAADAGSVPEPHPKS
ncbi:MAG: hypothetical protein LC670_14360, partial [Flavobacteriales bacterium]|nr:hypothetical protein [Flavobacteriales bacterium]